MNIVKKAFDSQPLRFEHLVEIVCKFYYRRPVRILHFVQHGMDPSWLFNDFRKNCKIVTVRHPTAYAQVGFGKQDKRSSARNDNATRPFHFAQVICFQKIYVEWVKNTIFSPFG